MLCYKFFIYLCLLGFVISSFNVKTILYVFGDLGSWVLMFVVQGLKMVAKRQILQLMCRQGHRLSKHGKFQGIIVPWAV